MQTRMLFGGNLTRQPAYLTADPHGDHPLFRTIGELPGADRMMNDAFFLGVYPGLTRPADRLHGGHGGDVHRRSNLMSALIAHNGPANPMTGATMPTSRQAAHATSFWRDRPVFVTGGTGLVGGWLVRRLRRRWARMSSAWCATGCRSRELVRAGLIERVKVVRGDVCDQALLERALGEYEIDTVFHLAAQTIVGIANRNPISTFETNIQGTWALLEACRRSPPVKQIVVASSDKAYGDQRDAALRRDDAAAGAAPLRREQVVRGPDRAHLRHATACRSASRAAATSTAAAT